MGGATPGQWEWGRKKVSVRRVSNRRSPCWSLLHNKPWRDWDNHLLVFTCSATLGNCAWECMRELISLAPSHLPTSTGLGSYTSGYSIWSGNQIPCPAVKYFIWAHKWEKQPETPDMWLATWLHSDNQSERPIFLDKQLVHSRQQNHVRHRVGIP